MVEALTATTEPALYQPLEGEMEPPAEGLAAVVRKYWVTKVALKVVGDEGAEIECEAAPESDQLENTYCVPVAPG